MGLPRKNIRKKRQKRIYFFKMARNLASGNSRRSIVYCWGRRLLMNITRSYKTSDEKIRQYTFRAKLHVPCPLKLHADALGSTIDKAFENQIDDLEESFESLPPKTDVWQTMSSMVFDRELSNLLSTVINDHLMFYFSNYGLNFLFLDLRMVSTV